MRYVRLYLKEKKKIIYMLLSLTVLNAAMLYLYDFSWKEAAYILVLEIVIVCIWSGFSFVWFVRTVRHLEKLLLLENIDEITFDSPETVREDLYQKLTRKQQHNTSEMKSRYDGAMSEMRDYYAIWAHQIKTPIAAMNLMLQVLEEHPEKIDVKALKSELFRIDFYTEAVMEYLRLEDSSSDFHFSQYCVKEIVYKAVKKFSSQFINKHLRVQIDCGEDACLYTDEKWLGFIVEQLLSNSIKYTDEGGEIRIYEERSEHGEVIVIEDNGMGIRQEDIPRIMERGYTGYNGRMDKKSSGIGLYLCKKAADKLGAVIEIQSQPHRGTKVRICFRQEHKIHE